MKTKKRIFKSLITVAAIIFLLIISYFYNGNGTNRTTEFPDKTVNVISDQPKKEVVLKETDDKKEKQQINNAEQTEEQREIKSESEIETEYPEKQKDLKNTDSPICVISVVCHSILGNLDCFDTNKLDILPSDGIILPETQVEFQEGESVFSVTHKVLKENKIHFEFTDNPMYSSVYVEGISNIYEFDCGELSGWMYKVNGWFPNYGCSRYQLKPGDRVEWVYTCDLGEDVGNRFTEKNK